MFQHYEHNMSVNGFDVKLKGELILMDDSMVFVVMLVQKDQKIVLYKSETGLYQTVNVEHSTKAWGFLFAKALETASEVKWEVVPTTIVKEGNND